MWWAKVIKVVSYLHHTPRWIRIFLLTLQAQLNLFRRDECKHLILFLFRVHSEGIHKDMPVIFSLFMLQKENWWISNQYKRWVKKIYLTTHAALEGKAAWEPSVVLLPSAAKAQGVVHQAFSLQVLYLGALFLYHFPRSLALLEAAILLLCVM